MPKRASETRSDHTLPDQQSDSEYCAIQPGQLFWIPKKENARGNLGLGRKAHDHPCVVLSGVQRNGKCTILIMTSLGGEDIMEKIWDPEFRQKQIPVSPTQRHPETGLLLYLRHGQQMERNSYVNTERCHEVIFEYLERFRGGPCYLCDESLQTVMTWSRFTPQSDSSKRECLQKSDSRLNTVALNDAVSESLASLSSRLQSFREIFDSIGTGPPIKLPTAFVQRLKTLDIYNGPTVDPNECLGFVLPAPTPPLLSSPSCSNRRYAFAPAARPIFPGTPSSSPFRGEHCAFTDKSLGGIVGVSDFKRQPPHPANDLKITSTLRASASRPIYTTSELHDLHSRRYGHDPYQPLPSAPFWRTVPDDDPHYLARQRAVEHESETPERVGGWILFGTVAAICYLACDFDVASYVNL